MPGIFSPSSSTTTVATQSNAGFSEVAGPAYNVNLTLAGKFRVKKGGTISPNIYLTDQGALARAENIASQSLRQVELFGGSLASSFNQAVEALRGTASQSIDTVAESQRGEVENVSLALVKWGALALAVYAAASFFKKG